MSSFVVDTDMVERFLRADARVQAGLIMRDPSPRQPGKMLHPGDPVGFMFVKLWMANEDAALFYLGFLFGVLCEIAEEMGEQRPRFGDVLVGLKYSVPPDCGSEEYASIVSAVWERFPHEFHSG